MTNKTISYRVGRVVGVFWVFAVLFLVVTGLAVLMTAWFLRFVLPSANRIIGL